MLREWRRLRQRFITPANLGEAELSVNTLFKSIDDTYVPAQFPLLAHQLVKACTRPSLFHRMPTNCEEVNELLHENKKQIARQIDLPPDLLEEILTPGFWEEFLCICYSSPESGNDDVMHITTDDDLPIISFPNVHRADGTQPNDNVFFFRCSFSKAMITCSQVIMVVAGRSDFQWFNLGEQTTGDVSRLRVLVFRFQPRLPWVEVSTGKSIQYSYEASNDDSDSESDDSDEFESGNDGKFVELDRPHLFREIGGYIPRDALHPNKTGWRNRDDANGILWLPSRGPQRPGFYHKLGQNETALVSVSEVPESDDSNIQCLFPLSEVLSGNIEVEIESERLVALFKGTLNDLRLLDDFNQQFYDPQSLGSLVYRKCYKVLEQMLHESGRRLKYVEAFDKNWATVSKGQTSSESFVVFLFPYDDFRSLMVANAKISTENSLVRMFVSFSEVGKSTQQYDSDPTPKEMLRLEIFGPQGVNLLRKCIERVSTGRSQEEEFETHFFRRSISKVDVDHRNKSHLPDPSDEGDMRNFKESTGLLITAINNSQFDIRISTSPSSKRFSSKSANQYYVVEQRIELKANSCSSKSEISVDITRIWTERKRRPQMIRDRLLPMKANDVHLSIKVRSSDDSVWPVQGKRSGVEYLVHRYIVDKDIHMGQCSILLNAFINGGNALLSCEEGSHWERSFYLERLITLNILVVDFVRFLSFITGCSSFECELQRSNIPRELVWTGKVEGDETVPSKNIRIEMYPEKYRHSGCGGHPGFASSGNVRYRMLTINVQVDLNIALARVCLITTNSKLFPCILRI